MLHAQNNCVLWVLWSQETEYVLHLQLYMKYMEVQVFLFSKHSFSNGAHSAFSTAVCYLQNHAKLFEVSPQCLPTGLLAFRKSCTLEIHASHLLYLTAHNESVSAVHC